MIKISNIHTYGWMGAICGMRNSRQSWDRADSSFGKEVELGPNDLELASRLAKLEGPHAKFRRMIHVQMDITAPLYWWKEFDTYKVGTTANSTSTMYSIMNRDFSVLDFSMASMNSAIAGKHLFETVKVLNQLRKEYKNAENDAWKQIYWHDVISLLPESYNQMRTVDLNYEVLSQMCRFRLYHKLDEWQKFCRTMFDSLPYAKELIFCDNLLD